MLSVAIIGAGHLGSIHAKLWSENNQVTLIAVVDPNEMRGKDVAERAGTQWYPSVDVMPNADAAVIACPTVDHYHIAEHCLLRGMHTFIEKPVTATYREAQSLIAIAAQSGKVVQVGHVERFNPAIRSLSSYSIEPMFIEGHRLATFKPRAIDVSVVYDLMIHDIDLLLWLTGSQITNVQATGVAVLTDTPDIGNARLTFANGCVANLTASRISAKPMRKLRIFQKESYLGIDLAAGTVEMFRLIDKNAHEPDHQLPVGNVTTQHGDKMIVLDTPTVVAANAIAEEQKSFLESISTQSLAAVTLAEGAEAVRIAELIEATMKENKFISSTISS